MTEFHFIRPLWLIAFIGLVWVLWQVRRLRVSSSAWHRVIPSHLSSKLLSNTENNRPVSIIPAALIGSLLIIAMAGPTWQKLPQPVYDVERGSVLVMDMSFSMLSTDIKPNRLTMARYKAMDLVEKIDEGEIGLIAYAGDAFTISPLTADINNIRLLLPSLSPQIMPELGSNPYPALILAEQMLQNAGHIKGDIYWVTDGVTQDEIDDINDFVDNSDHRINILAVGTAEGAPITLANGELMKDRRGNIVIPKLTSRRLEAFSDNSGGVFTVISADDSDLARLSSLSALDAQKVLQSKQQNMGDQWQEFGPYLLLIALPLALAYFRKGILLTPVLMVSLLSSTFYSAPSSASLWDDLWQTKNQQGQQQFDNQDYQKAAQTFDDNQWRGSSYYRAGDYEKAVETFAKSDTVQANYNRANALAKLGELEQAIAAYEQVISADAEHQDALTNKAIVEQMLQQQQQEQQNQEQQDNQDQSQDQNQDQSQEQNQEQQQQDQNQQQQGSSDSSDSNQDQSQQDSSEQSDPEQSEQQQSEQQGDEDNNQDQSSDSDNGEQNKQQAEQDQSEQEQQAAAQQQNSEQQQQPEQQQQQQAALTDGEQQSQTEQQQKHEQLLRRVTDDPQLLLRNKMRLEYQKRRQNRSSIGVKEKW